MKFGAAKLTQKIGVRIKTSMWKQGGGGGEGRAVAGDGLRKAKEGGKKEKKEMRKIKRKAIQLIFPLGFYDNSCANEMKGSIIYKDRNENWNLSRADFISNSTATHGEGSRWSGTCRFYFRARREERRKK